MYSIIVKFDLEGSHYWDDAPDEYKLLKSAHSHNFHFEVEIPVLHSDRALEILEVRRVLRRAMLNMYGTGALRDEPCNFISNSCERLAQWLETIVFNTYKMHANRVTVMEDEFVGAVYRP